ncbi:TRAP transporter small permease [Limnohabitans sp. Rim8]|uniref:TRAP transporter small permease n=1 Tax=Limnohabitans sp. Rim8 TaxID=1100718 RepID=UPI0026291D26|nr:TRAP transporter small permease [Limnohabitans sp. Rim8]
MLIRTLSLFESILKSCKTTFMHSKFLHTTQKSARQPKMTQQPHSSFFNRLMQFSSSIGTIWIAFLMFLIVADVIGRNFLDRPITGVAEFASRSIVAIVFLQLAAGITSGRMLRSDTLLQVFWRRAPWLGRTLEVSYSLVGAVTFSVLTFIAWPEFVDSWRNNDYFGTRGVFMVSSWPFHALLVLGSAFTAFAFMASAVAFLRGVQPAGGVDHG